jgi:hypothetical protein
VRCDRRVRRFTTCWTHFGGPRGHEDGYSPSRAREVVGLDMHVVSCRSRLRLCHLVTLRVTLPPLQVSLREDLRIETASTVPREEGGFCDPR